MNNTVILSVGDRVHLGFGVENVNPDEIRLRIRR